LFKLGRDESGRGKSKRKALNKQSASKWVINRKESKIKLKLRVDGVVSGGFVLTFFLRLIIFVVREKT
jgi:hypothetical protein